MMPGIGRSGRDDRGTRLRGTPRGLAQGFERDHAPSCRAAAWPKAARRHCGSTIIPVLDPALVVLGGGIGLAGAALLPAIREQVEAWLPIPAPEFAI
ncbi:hypothetical protein [Burkholderia gladioli]|uniref:hypothetical protein n=1 Tax=Burkholderia gladioli TaxID=28095 RepID=UPI00264B8653|nr:hypothetical protein [Burkholderia gladioli]MDN7748565.1 hypothetical protein [Burkholderia gladioli]